MHLTDFVRAMRSGGETENEAGRQIYSAKCVPFIESRARDEFYEGDHVAVTVVGSRTHFLDSRANDGRDGLKTGHEPVITSCSMIATNTVTGGETSSGGLRLVVCRPSQTSRVTIAFGILRGRL
jgi:hypothetical protein